MSRFCRHPYFETFAQQQREDALDECKTRDALDAQADQRMVAVLASIKDGARTLQAVR